MKPKSMKTILLAALMAPGALFAQTTATTTPVGYVSLGDTTAGQPAIKANTDVLVSIPLSTAVRHSGNVASTSASTVTFSNAPAFAANAWTPVTGEPFMLVIESGAKSGSIHLITSHTADTVTVDVNSFNLTGIIAGDKVSIRPCWTVATLMAGASSQNGLALFGYSGNAAGVNNSSDLPYFFNGTNWEDGDGNPAGNVALYPGEGFIVRSGNTSITSFILSGEVPIAKSSVVVGQSSVSPRDSVLGYFSPVNEGLLSSALGVAAGDILFDYDNGAAGVNKSGVPYFFTGTSWEDGDGNPADAYNLTGGKGYVFRRATAASTGFTTWSDTQSYIPSL